MITIESRHEAALNAAVEALTELGVRASLHVHERSGPDDLYWVSLSGGVPGAPGAYCTGIANTGGEALRDFVNKCNEVIANPPPKEITTAAAAKAEAKRIVEEARKAEVYPAELDDIADQIEAIPVRNEGPPL